MPKEVERIKRALMEDPDFKPQGDKTKEESAWSVAWSKYPGGVEKANTDYEEIIHKLLDLLEHEEAQEDVEDGQEIEKAPQLYPPRPGLKFDASKHKWVREESSRPSTFNRFMTYMEKAGWKHSHNSLPEHPINVGGKDHTLLDHQKYFQEHPVVESPSFKPNKDTFKLDHLGNKIEIAQRVKLLADLEEGFPTEFGTVIQLGRKDTIIVEVFPQYLTDEGDDGLREVSLDQVESMKT